MEYFQYKITLTGGGIVQIVTNIPPEEGEINTITAAIDNWAARTNEYTDKSLVDYINSKNVHHALTLAEADKQQIKY